MNKVLLYFIIVTMISCSKKEIPSYENLQFDNIVKRNLTIIKNNFIFNSFVYMEIVDSLLIIKSETNDNNMRFHVFNKKDGVHINSFGTVGRAKGELLEPFSLISRHDKNIYAAGINQKKIVTYAIPNLSNHPDDYTTELTLPFVINSVFILYLKDNTYLFAYNFNDRYAILNEGKDTISTYANYPTTSKQDLDVESARNNYFALNSFISLKPDKSKFVNVTRNGLILEIFNIRNNRIQPQTIKYFYEPKYNIENGDIGDCVKGAGGLACTDDFIYIIFRDTKNSLTNKIAVFDWQGNAIKQYILDYPIVNLSIDEEDNKMYVATYIDGDFLIAHFNL